MFYYGNVVMCPFSGQYVLFATEALHVGYQLTGSVWGAIKNYFFVSNLGWFQLFDVPFAVALFMEVFRIQRIIARSCINVFLILSTIPITFRLRQVLDRVRQITRRNENVPLTEWRKMREDYVEIYRIKKLTNDKFAWFILQTFGESFYCILFYLVCFKIAKLERAAMIMVYEVVIEFGLIMIVVCLYCGQIEETNVKIAVILHQVSAKQYNPEVKRFLKEVVDAEMTFTAKNFFNVNRSLVLKFASSVLTYELALIQFNVR